ncbi:hypothetical protein M1105_16480 [Limibaculum sp. FT325]|uniref:hypothetical protein n=1 Tax=Thermohalobaculum sediminis TaxID=2939436 RepID=UPI0020BE45FB|nr:hypothetical protein [Limibaculum sediminis]MCL5778576.1 hypothetical protein [Limibaculum sediminis]
MPLFKALGNALSLEKPRPRWHAHRDYARKALIIVQCFYVIVLLQFVDFVSSLQRMAAAPEGFQPLWPVLWVDLVGLEVAAKILIPAMIATGMAAVIMWHCFWVRLASSILILQYTAISNSWGAMNHGYHELFWISVCFIFLPNARNQKIISSRVAIIQLLTCVSAAMLLILLFYTMSGAYKVIDALQMLLAGEKGGFSPHAMADTLAWRLMETKNTPIFADFIIENPLIGWPMFFWIYYAELVAIVIFFRPALHRAWGIGLIIFHFGTIVFIEIAFPLHIVFNALLFMMSPYHPGRVHSKEMVASLPILGIVLRRGLGWHAAPVKT